MSNKAKPELVRTQILIEEEQREGLYKLAQKKPGSMGSMVREAVAEYLRKHENEDVDDALEESFGAWNRTTGEQENLRTLRQEWDERLGRISENDPC